MGRYSAYPSASNQSGMTGTSAEIAALIAAMAIPSYSTPYYGTSGFNGNTQTYAWTPYPDHAVTWKNAFYLNTTTVYGFPNRRSSSAWTK